MFKDTITLFNFHEPTGKWYPTVITGVDLQVDSGADPATPGVLNDAHSVLALIQSRADKTLVLKDGATKSYLGPKAYAKCDTPEGYFTFQLEKDFFYEGEWPSLDPVLDDDYDEGFYNEVNKTYDGVYIVKTATHLRLIPHFEIGGK